MKEKRIPFGVESPRGDDKLGTNPTGEIVSDFEATQQGVPFKQGVPQDKIQEVVETQLKDNKWVTTEDNKGNTEILTKEDIPKEQEKEQPKDDEELKDFAKEMEAKKEKKSENWKNTFNETSTTSSPTTSSPTTPNKKWEHKFDEVKSATSTFKSKGG